MQISKLKPHGFVLTMGLLPLVSKTALHVFECLRLRLAPNRKMSLMQELLSGCKSFYNSNFQNDLPEPKYFYEKIVRGEVKNSFWL